MRISSTRRWIAASATFATIGSSRFSTAETVTPRIGPAQVLAHHKHYDPHYDPRWPDPYDSPRAICAAVDGDQIVVSVQQKFLWLNGNNGARVRETPMPFISDECAMAFAQHGAGRVLVFAGRQSVADPPFSNLTFVVTTEDGKLLSRKSWSSDAHTSSVDMQSAGRWFYFNHYDGWGHTGPVRSFDLDTLSEGRSFDVAGYFGLFGDGRAVHAIDEHQAAWLLTPDSPPKPDARPGTSVVMQGCPDGPDPLPVVLRDDLSIAMDYGRPGADCDAQEGFNLRDASGRLVTRRPIRNGSWRFGSFILPWNDGIRVVAQRSDLPGFQIWKVPIAF
jgi:hypothetical protein